MIIEQGQVQKDTVWKSLDQIPVGELCQQRDYSDLYIKVSPNAIFRVGPKPWLFENISDVTMAVTHYRVVPSKLIYEL